MPVLRPVRLLLTTDHCTALKAQASRTGESVSAIVRRAVDAHLARLRPEGRLEALRGARGLWRSRPTDLGANRDWRGTSTGSGSSESTDGSTQG